MAHTGIRPDDLAALRRFDTCTLSNAIESLNLRPRNEGYIQGGLSCMFPTLQPVTGYAVTGRMRSATPPINGRCYYDHIDWWHYVASLPAPRMIVLYDADDPPGAGALFGEMHARISMALNVAAYVTNGAVRDLGGVERLGFQLFASKPSVSHAYAHVVDFGEPVVMGGLTIHSGDLLHGDRHGILSIPREVARELPGIAARLMQEEGDFIKMCLDGNFSIERMAAKLREEAEGKKCK